VNAVTTGFSRDVLLAVMVFTSALWFINGVLRSRTSLSAAGIKLRKDVRCVGGSIHEKMAESCIEFTIGYTTEQPGFMTWRSWR
jgi:hypothetical protein